MSKKVFMTSLVLLGASQAFAGNEAVERLDAEDGGAIGAEDAAAVDGPQEAMADRDLNGDRHLDRDEHAQFVESMQAKTTS